MKKIKIRDTNNKGFTLIELAIVITILGILVLIAVPSYNGYLGRAAKEVCHTNCLQLERMYHVYLLMENKNNTIYEFKEFLSNYKENICPANGDIEYVYGIVRCILHSSDEANESDNGEDDEDVPFL